MNESPQEWIAYLRELADAQTVKQIAVNIRQAADCFESQRELLRECLEAWEGTGPGIVLDRIRKAIS
jgi:hypothetical protein